MKQKKIAVTWMNNSNVFDLQAGGNRSESI